MVNISEMKSNTNATANANDNFVDIAKKEEERRCNFYNLHHTDKEIRKAFDDYFERAYNGKMYGHPFIEEEVVVDSNGVEFLFYDEESFLKITLLVFLMLKVGHTILMHIGLRRFILNEINQM